MQCGGTTTSEFCGGNFKMSVDEMGHDDYSGYTGRYNDGPVQAINAEGIRVTGDMTNHVSLAVSTTLHNHADFLASPTSTNIALTAYTGTREVR